MEITFNTHGNEKQKEAARAWINPLITDIGYGGAKAGGKSYLGVSLIFGDAFIYPDTRYFIGRQTLNDLRKWTSGTIDKVFTEWGVTSVMWKYNGQDNFYELHNKSRIYFIELSEIPSDPDFTRFGSREFTRGWIEEEGEVSEKAVQNIGASIGRYNNLKYNLVGKVLHTFNPAKNHLYRNYFKPHRLGDLPDYKCFINALPQDNKMLPAGYIENLHRILSYNQKQRLLFGNWEYDDDPTAMCDWEAITDCFTNEIAPSPDSENKLSADLAMKGRDRFIAGLIQDSDNDGIVITLVTDMPKASGRIIEENLREHMRAHHVGHSNTIVDSDGMGAYLESYLEGIHEFHGGARAVNDVEFYKIKDELGYRLSEYVNTRRLRIICTTEQRERIEQQLSALKADDIDADTKKKRIVNKEVMKEQIGHSPDELDMLLMAMWFYVHEYSTGCITR